MSWHFTFAYEFGVDINIGTVRDTFSTSCFKTTYNSYVGDFIDLKSNL